MTRATGAVAVFSHSTMKQGISAEHVHAIATAFESPSVTNVALTRTNETAEFMSKYKGVVHDFGGELEDYYKDHQDK